MATLKEEILFFRGVNRTLYDQARQLLAFFWKQVLGSSYCQYVKNIKMFRFLMQSPLYDFSKGKSSPLLSGYCNMVCGIFYVIAFEITHAVFFRYFSES